MTCVLGFKVNVRMVTYQWLIDRTLGYLHRERWTVREPHPASDAAAAAAAVWSGDARASPTGDTS